MAANALGRNIIYISNLINVPDKEENVQLNQPINKVVQRD